MSGELKKLNRKKGGFKTSLTNFCTFLANKKKLFASNPEAKRKIYLELEARLSEIETAIVDFRNVQEQIAEIASDDVLQHIAEETSLFENTFYEQIALAKEFFEILSKEPTADSSTAIDQSFSTPNLVQSLSNCQIKLPTIALPKYSGIHTKWREFKDTFEALIHNCDGLSEIQKFYYLRASLEGDAAFIIASLEVSAANYASAWASVCERYDNKRLLVQNHLRALFSLQETKKESAMRLREMLDTVTQHLRALKNLEQPVEHWDSMIIYIVSSKFDDVTAREWESQKLNGVLPTLEELKTFIRNKAMMLETLNFDRVETKAKADRAAYVKPKTFISTELKCYFCKESHSIYGCPKLANLQVEERIKECKALKLCLNCLRPGHIAYVCTQRGCIKCRQRHNSLLHLSRQDESGKKAMTAVANTQVSSILPTALANVPDIGGCNKVARLLLDCGSQCNFISEIFAKKLGLKIERANLRISGIANCETGIIGTCKIKICSRHENSSFELTCLVVKEISGFLPQTKLPYQKIPRECKLADPGYAIPGEINILIGAEIFWDILRSEQRLLGKNKPVLRETALGWILAGTVPVSGGSNQTKCYFNKNIDVQAQLERFWKIEECQGGSILSEEEGFCETHFNDTFTRAKDGRFVVSIPFIKAASLLGDSEVTARKRFFNLEQRLRKYKKINEQYAEFMTEYERLGHMSKVGQMRSKQEYFLPHHAVIKDTSKTTRLRVVFDASCPTSTGFSLNDIQAVGPIIQNDLADILIRFRQHAIAISADIAKMYRQVYIKPEERALQQIVWRSEPSQPLDIYQLNTVTYGMSSASFLAIRCLWQLACENKEKYPVASEIIKRDFYVDDLLTGAETVEKASKLVSNITKILEAGCFSLRKWVSNDPKALKTINASDKMAILNLGENENTKTLGLYWDPSRDTFLFKIESLDKTNIATKRNILAAIGQIFDPLGLIGACTVRAKMILQLLWQKQLDWDDPIEDSISNLWYDFRKDLLALNHVQIPRCIKAKGGSKLQLHGFGDASERAYGACVYLRYTNEDANVEMRLITSKSKIAPLKTQTIPRLELSASLLTAKLVHKVLTALRLELEEIFLWSDSKIVLAWLKTAPHMLKIFVANRVVQINDLIPQGVWRYIPSAQNPADLLSRGTSAATLRENDLWWSGPSCIRDDPERWPSNPILNGDLPELKPSVNACFVNTLTNGEFILKFSEFLRAKRVTAYVMRLRNINNTTRAGGILKVEEIEAAEKILIKNTQKCMYFAEVKDLKAKKKLPKHSQLISLNPFLDKDELLRVGGRLKFSYLPTEQIHPIILPPRSHFLYLLFKREHVRLGHAGPAQMLFSVREKYWPVHGRKVARRVVHECIRCYKAKPRNSTPMMGCLPEERLKPSHPFKNTGIDYAGPFLIKKFKGRGSRNIKCYIAIFVCMVTKASHLEVVSDLTTEAFLAAFKRFAARRGKPSRMQSDNGTNFVGADRELRAIVESLKKDKAKIGDYFSGEGISWRFIPASAPHFGGLWEGTVKRTKFHLKRIIGNLSFTFEEFTTIACQVEAILNSRPLCPLSTHPEDLEPLTPGHFLIGRSLSALPEGDLRDIPEGRLSSFQRIQRLTQHFWARWSREYLPELQTRSKWRSNNEDFLRAGDLVLIREDNQPPLCWPLGRITILHPGSDKIPRVATVRTRKGLLKRPVAKLYRLPLQRDGEETSESA